MARFLTWCVLAASLAGIVGCRDDAREGVPEFVCAEPVYDFGEVSNLEAPEHVFVFRNRGHAPLRLGRVKPACSCTVGKVSCDLVPPGGKATLAVRLSLLGLRGHVRERLSVESNDPCQPWMLLCLEGTVREDVVLMPYRMSFVGITSEAQARGTGGLLVKKPDLSLDITRVETDTPCFAAELEVVKPGRAYRVHIRAARALPEGVVSGRIRLLTGTAAGPTIEIPVKADLLGELVVFPHEIVLSTAGCGTGAAGPYVAIVPGKTQTFELRSVEAPLPSIKTRTVPLGQLGYKIELTVPVVTKDLQGRTLRITTNVEKMREILVPFRVVDN
jgi:hypothetical protein